MAITPDEAQLLDVEADDFTSWADALGGEELARALAKERAAELENELEQDERPIDYNAELEDAEEEAAPTSEKRLKRELRAEALRRLEDAARTEADFTVVVKETATGSAGNGTMRICAATYRWNIWPYRSRGSCRAG